MVVLQRLAVCPLAKKRSFGGGLKLKLEPNDAIRRASSAALVYLCAFVSDGFVGGLRGLQQQQRRRVHST